MTTESEILTKWVDGRLNGVKIYIVDNFFTGKTVLDLGYNLPSAGPKLAALGASVTIYDISQGNLDTIKALHPDVSVEQIDLATGTIRQKYDAIWDTEVLDLMDDPERHLLDVCTNCDYLFLDSLVFDSSDTTASFILQHGKARPRPGFIDDVLSRHGFTSIMPIDTAFDAESRHHGWVPNNDNECRENHCRFWIAWRSTVTSPLKAAPEV